MIDNYLYYRIKKLCQCKVAFLALLFMAIFSTNAQTNISNTVIVGNNSMYKSASIDSIETGAIFNYKLHVTLYGDGTLVTLTDQLPPELDLVGNATDIDISIPTFIAPNLNPSINNTNLITVSLQSPSNGNSTYIEVLIPVRFKCGVTPDGTIVNNTATITSNGQFATTNSINVEAIAELNWEVKKQIIAPTTKDAAGNWIVAPGGTTSALHRA